MLMFARQGSSGVSLRNIRFSFLSLEEAMKFYSSMIWNRVYRVSSEKQTTPIRLAQRNERNGRWEMTSFGEQTLKEEEKFGAFNILNIIKELPSNLQKSEIENLQVHLDKLLEAR